MFAWSKLPLKAQVLVDRVYKRHKATNVGRFALERQAGGNKFEHVPMRTIAFPIPNQKQ